jgi:tRNA threonylcarbamoyladenosine biosynthesis protein TsaE
MASHFTRELADEAATLAVGKQFAKNIKNGNGLVVYMHGDLGVGKTTFVRGVLQGLGHVGKVKSPTYTLVEPYVVSSYNIYHFDLYRFLDESEWEAAGFREYFNSTSLCLVEWPEKAHNLLPKPDFDIKMDLINDHDPDEGRKIEIIAHRTFG